VLSGQSTIRDRPSSICPESAEVVGAGFPSVSLPIPAEPEPGNWKPTDQNRPQRFLILFLQIVSPSRRTIKKQRAKIPPGDAMMPKAIQPSNAHGLVQCQARPRFNLSEMGPVRTHYPLPTNHYPLTTEPCYIGYPPPPFFQQLNETKHVTQNTTSLAAQNKELTRNIVSRLNREIKELQAFLLRQRGQIVRPNRPRIPQQSTRTILGEHR